MDGVAWTRESRRCRRDGQPSRTRHRCHISLPPAEFGDYIEHATVLAHTDTG
jgi:hypothetical protein